MNRVRGLAAGLGVAALMVVGVACGSDGTQASKDADAPADQLPLEGLSVSPPSSASMLPYPNDVDQLVAWSDVIVLGTISSAPEEKRIGPYVDGKPLPAEEAEVGMPVTDYEVQIESVLAGHDAVADGDTLVLRMFGHLSSQGATITSVVFQLPNTGDRLLFALGRNPDGTYGTGPQGLLDVSGETVAFADGAPFVTGTTPEQLMQDIRNVASECVGNARTRRCEGSGSGSIEQPTDGPSGQAAQTGPVSELAGPLDTTWAEVTVLSVEDDMATMRTQEIRDYYRVPHATYPELSVGDEVLVRVYNIAPLGAVSGAGSVATGVEVGTASPEIPQPVLVEGESYLADMSVCFSGFIDGLGCPFEGWSAAIFPLQALPASAPPENSDGTPPSSTPLGGARLTAPLPGNGAEALQLELFYGQRQDLVGNLGAVLAANEPETFAGLWIEHEPQFKVVVLFTSDGEETIQRYVAGKPVADFVEVRVARVALTELHNAQADANRAVDELGIPYNSSTDVKANSVEIWVTDLEALNKALRGADLKLPSDVEAVKVDALASPG